MKRLVVLIVSLSFLAGLPLSVALAQYSEIGYEYPGTTGCWVIGPKSGAAIYYKDQSTLQPGPQLAILAEGRYLEALDTHVHNKIVYFYVELLDGTNGFIEVSELVTSGDCADVRDNWYQKIVAATQTDITCENMEWLVRWDKFGNTMFYNGLVLRATMDPTTGIVTYIDWDDRAVAQQYASELYYQDYDPVISDRLPAGDGIAFFGLVGINVMIVRVTDDDILYGIVTPNDLVPIDAIPQEAAYLSLGGTPRTVLFWGDVIYKAGTNNSSKADIQFTDVRLSCPEV